jgi:hypothetical protein
MQRRIVNINDRLLFELLRERRGRLLLSVDEEDLLHMLFDRGNVLHK